LPRLAQRYIVDNGSLAQENGGDPLRFQNHKGNRNACRSVSKHWIAPSDPGRRNRVEDAMRLIKPSPTNAAAPGATQALGSDARADSRPRLLLWIAVRYAVEPRDESKALRIYNRFCARCFPAASRAHRALCPQAANHNDEP